MHPVTEPCKNRLEIERFCLPKPLRLTPPDHRTLQEHVEILCIIYFDPEGCPGHVPPGIQFQALKKRCIRKSKESIKILPRTCWISKQKRNGTLEDCTNQFTFHYKIAGISKESGKNLGNGRANLGVKR